MITKSPKRILTIFGVVLLSVLLTLTACGGQPAPAPAPTPAPTPAPKPAPAPAPAPKADPAALRAKGEELYQKTAGGIGCKSCHGADAKGTNTGPIIRGKASAEEIKRALAGDAMSFIRLTNEEIEAIEAYLKYLESQP